MLKKIVRANIFLIGIIVLAIVLRFAFITSVPVSSNDDQIHYMLNSQSFLLSGKDTTGTISPLDILLFRYPPHEFPQAELPYFLEMLSFSLFGASFLTSLIPNLLLSVGTVVVAYLVGKELLGEEAGLVTGLITAINPWSIFIGRTAYEPTAATFFFLLALYIFLKAKKWMILVSIPVLYAAFYSYIGTKLIFIPFVVISLLYSYFFVHKRRFAIQYASVFLASLLIVALLFFQLHSNPSNSRLNEIFLPTNEIISQQVNDLRKQSIPSPVLPLINKLTVYKDILTINTFTTLSPLYLFMTGDYFFSQQRHGLFYVIDALFLLLGVIGLYRKDRRVLLLLTAFIAIGLLPQILHGRKEFGNFTPHIIVVITTFIFMIGYGIVFVIQEVKPKYRLYASVGIGVLYFFSTISFLSVYLTEAPKQAGIFNFPERVAARYIKESSQFSHVTVLSSDPAISYRNYIFYSNSYTKDTAKEINTNLTKRSRDDYTLPTIRFVSCTGVIPNPTDTVVQEGRCYLKGSGSLRIPDLAGMTSAYTIYNDRLCKNTTLNLYQTLSVTKLNVEAMGTNNFCRTLITN